VVETAGPCVRQAAGRCVCGRQQVVQAGVQVVARAQAVTGVLQKSVAGIWWQVAGSVVGAGRAGPGERYAGRCSGQQVWRCVCTQCRRVVNQECRCAGW